MAGATTMAETIIDIETLMPWQKDLLTGVKAGEMYIIHTARQTGKSFYQQYVNNWNAIMDQPVKILWKRKGLSLTAYTEDGQLRGLRDADMDEVQKWVWDTMPETKRMSFDTWHFKKAKHITMFLMRWSS